jgi:hypothetical protein
LLPKYVADRIFSRSPLKAELPWFCYDAIEFLQGWVGAEMVVYEYGSGGSTLFFAHRAKRLVSIEDHPGWAELV